jgi:hypothetical protein
MTNSKNQNTIYYTDKDVSIRKYHHQANLRHCDTPTYCAHVLPQLYVFGTVRPTGILLSDFTDRQNPILETHLTTSNIFWLESQLGVYCHTAKLEPNRRVTIDRVPLWVIVLSGAQHIFDMFNRSRCCAEICKISEVLCLNCEVHIFLLLTVSLFVLFSSFTLPNISRKSRAGKW